MSQVNDEIKNIIGSQPIGPLYTVQYIKLRTKSTANVEVKSYYFMYYLKYRE